VFSVAEWIRSYVGVGSCVAGTSASAGWVHVWTLSWNGAGPDDGDFNCWVWNDGTWNDGTWNDDE
jgi:hypothetical protein